MGYQNGPPLGYPNGPPMGYPNGPLMVYPSGPPMGYPNRPLTGFQNQPTTSLPYRQQPSQGAGQVHFVENARLGAQLTMNIPRVPAPFQRQGQRHTVGLPHLGGPGQRAPNIPRVQPVSQRRAQTYGAKSQDSAASCKACYDMDPRLQPKRAIPALNPDQINIRLPNFLQASHECPFCNLLVRIFEKHVDGAEKKVKAASRKETGSLTDPSASVVIKPGHPVVITFSEGLHAGASVTWNDRVDGKKEKPKPRCKPKVYYPPPILVYFPPGKLAPRRIRPLVPYLTREQVRRYQIGPVLATSKILVNRWTTKPDSSTGN